MRRQELREKDKQVFNMIIEDFLKIGKPVSSESIAQKSQVRVSPATVRNIMVKLEEHGFLFQPHTSAGRIPTDEGLRFYVNNLLAELEWPEENLSFPFEDLSTAKSDISALLNQASNILAEYSDNLGFVIYPRISKINFHHVRFIKVSEESVMIILASLSNLILTRVFNTETYFTQVELDKASQYINQSFKGKNFIFIRNYLLRELPKYRLKYETIINRLISLLKAYFSQEEEGNQIVLQGVPKLLEKHYLIDMESLKSLLRNFEEKAKLTKLISSFISLGRVKVLIGSELSIPDISGFSLILSHYGDRDQVLGSLGIIGPKFIPYRKIIPLVDCVAKRLSQTMSLSS